MLLISALVNSGGNRSDLKVWSGAFGSGGLEGGTSKVSSGLRFFVEITTQYKKNLYEKKKKRKKKHKRRYAYK